MDLTGLLRRGACRLRGTFTGGLAAERSRLRDKLRARKRTQTTLVDGRAVGFLDPGSIPGASTNVTWTRILSDETAG